MKKHGHTKHNWQSPTYTTWAAMKARCSNSSSPHFPKYGAKGVHVCQRWMKFENFLADMGERPRETTIDRIDGSKGYFKSNCRWASIGQQQTNLKNNVFITYKGKTACRNEWSRISGIDNDTLAYRLKRGWDLDKVFSVKPFTGNRISSGVK